MDNVSAFLTELQPAAVIVVIIAALSLVASRTIPGVGPWAALLGLVGVAGYVGNQVNNVENRPEWLLFVALGGAVLAVIAGIRLLGAIRANTANDHTVGYVFPTLVAVIGLWMTVALIRFEDMGLSAAVHHVTTPV